MIMITKTGGMTIGGTSQEAMMHPFRYKAGVHVSLCRRSLKSELLPAITLQVVAAGGFYKRCLEANVVVLLHDQAGSRAERIA
jgi:hypothetical protein